MPNDLIDDETQELLAECRVESRSIGESSQPGDLHGLTVRVGGSKPDRRLVLTNPFCDLESLGEQVDERGVDVVDARTAFTKDRIVIHGEDRTRSCCTC